MKTYISYLVMAFVLALVSTGCDEITLEGNGISKTENRYVAHFDEVNSSGNFIVNISYGKEFDVSVEAESNLLPYIKTEVTKGRLDIKIRGIHIFDNSLPMKVNIVMPALTAIQLSGSGEINTGIFNANYFEIVVSGSGKVFTVVDTETIDITVSGSGEVEIEGGADGAEMLVSGSGQIYAFDFPLNDCQATVSGSGKIHVYTLGVLDAVISGSGSVYYIGNPRVNARISGSGKVIDAN